MEVYMDGAFKTHKDLLVWQRAMLLAEAIYRVTKSFPSDERFGLVSQMRRAAVSIPSNIAEGAARRTSADYLNFLHIARGSLAELETQAMLAERFGWVNLQGGLSNDFERLGQLLNALLVAITKRRDTPRSAEPRIPNPESRVTRRSLRK
jgi:four helix bundle protein